jgi:hypothetical protein
VGAAGGRAAGLGQVVGGASQSPRHPLKLKVPGGRKAYKPPVPSRRVKKSESAKPKPRPKPAGAKAKAKEPDDWRAKALAGVRALIRQADPEAVEDVTWRKPSNAMAGVPVWSHDGIFCTGETYKDKVKITFAKGASLEDPAGLFNSSLDGGTRRAIDIHEGDKIDEKAFKDLVRAAAALNTSGD